MTELMDSLRESRLNGVFGLKLVRFVDYGEQYEENESGERKPIDLPKSNVLLFGFEKDFTLIVRPSGTEPKIKFYYTTMGETKEESMQFYKEVSAKTKIACGL